MVKMPSDKPETWGEMVWTQLDDGKARLGKADVTAVASHTEEGLVYYLMDFGWIVVCTCKGFRFRSDCSHVRAFLDERG